MPIKDYLQLFVYYSNIQIIFINQNLIKYRIEYHYWEPNYLNICIIWTILSNIKPSLGSNSSHLCTSSHLQPAISSNPKLAISSYLAIYQYQDVLPPHCHFRKIATGSHFRLVDIYIVWAIVAAKMIIEIPDTVNQIFCLACLQFDKLILISPVCWGISPNVDIFDIVNLCSFMMLDVVTDNSKLHLPLQTWTIKC